MQPSYTVHVVPSSEWRWVILIAVGLVLLAFLPFMWIALVNDPQSDWQFMGVIGVNYPDGATYLSKMTQGMEGEWTLRFLHTPEPHTGAFIQPVYLLLGHAARLSGLNPILMFHIARVGASLFMYLAIYQLGAVIWMRLRSRRIFFVIASVGSGFGWLLAPLTLNTTFPDISIPEAFPLFSTYVNVHFPLTLACMALLASIFIIAFRPGMDEDPSISNGGLSALALSLLLGLLYPQVLVPIGGALALLLIVRAIRERRVNMRIVRWSLTVFIPAAMMFMYYFAITTNSPILSEWNRQNVTTAPSPLVFLLGIGVPLLIALPGIYRALRRFEADGDQFMLVWLAAMLIAIYLPTNVQRRFAAGLMILIAYFATRAIEDYWFEHIARRWRSSIFVVLIPVMMMSQLFVLMVPILPILVGNPQQAAGMMLARDYQVTFEWLRQNSRDGDVVLASPNVSTWVPAWTGERVVFGHPFETMQAEEKKNIVTAWYTASTVEECQQLLDGAYSFAGEYQVRYIIVGPEERVLGSDESAVESECLSLDLQELATFGEVTIYAP